MTAALSSNPRASIFDQSSMGSASATFNTTHTSGRARITNIQNVYQMTPDQETIVSMLACASAGVLNVNQCSEWMNAKQICVRGTLFSDGRFDAEVHMKSNNVFHGCRGGAVAVGSDQAGTSIWTATLPGKTAGGLSDPFCSSERKLLVTVHVDAEAAKQTTDIHIFYHFDEISFQAKAEKFVKNIGVGRALLGL